MSDSIMCRDNEDAKEAIDSIGSEHIADWEFLPNGKIMLTLNCKVEEIKERANE